MNIKKRRFFLTLIILFLSLLELQSVSGAAQAQLTEDPTLALQNPSSDELIYFTNLRRTQFGLSALTVNNILMTGAQQTAEIMAGLKLPGHLGGASLNISQMGYGDGYTIYSTENVAFGTGLSAEYIVYTIWNDDIHNIPVMNPIYCDIGAGVAFDSDGTGYYVLLAAYSEKRYCGEYRAPDGTTIETLYANKDISEDSIFASTGSQWIQPVSKVTPNINGKIIHEVNYGQTLWNIAIAYNTTIKQIQILNGYAEDDQTIYVGQKLIIPTSLTPIPTLESIASQTPHPSIITSSMPMFNTTPSPSPAVENSPTPMLLGEDNNFFIKLLLWFIILGLFFVLFGILMKRIPSSE
jgi:LysM repeat protein